MSSNRSKDVKQVMFATCRTLSGLAAVHCEVRRLVGLQSYLLHTWTVNLHVLWMAAFSNCHLDHNTHKLCQQLRSKHGNQLHQQPLQQQKLHLL